MKNVMLIYRGQVFLSELQQKYNEYKDKSNLIVVVAKEADLIMGDYMPQATLYTVQQLLEGELDHMQFDVIVGNPPYQGASDNIKLWNVIAIKCIEELLVDGGEIMFICPRTIVQGSLSNKIVNKTTNKLQKILEQKAFISYDETTDKHFNVGVKICSWRLKNTISKDPTTFVMASGETKVVQYTAGMMLESTTRDSIVSKFINSDHSRYTIKRQGRRKSDVVSIQSESHPIPVIWNSKAHEVMYSSKVIDNSLKLCMNNYKKFCVSDKNLLITTEEVSPAYFYITGGVEELTKIRDLWNTSKLFQYIGENYRNTKLVFLIAQRQHTIPVLDVNREWTDEEIYAEFGLTEEEINLIEGK
jgi:hypothetical protein